MDTNKLDELDHGRDDDYSDDEEYNEEDCDNESEDEENAFDDELSIFTDYIQTEINNIFNELNYQDVKLLSVKTVNEMGESSDDESSYQYRTVSVLLEHNNLKFTILLKFTFNYDSEVLTINYVNLDNDVSETEVVIPRSFALKHEDNDELLDDYASELISNPIKSYFEKSSNE